MLHRFFQNRKFFSQLLRFDADLAEKAKAECCPHCGDHLHQAHYQRKPRGGPCIDDLDEEFNLRFSFCCYDCRKRLTPHSLRFLGRKVYLGGILVLVSALLGDASAHRRKKLRDLCGADERTLARWRKWWSEAFSGTAVWLDLTARLVLIDSSAHSIPRLLLKSFKIRSLCESLQGALQCLLPMTGGVAPG